MRYGTVVSAAVAGAATAYAHVIPGAPQFVGGHRAIADLGMGSVPIRRSPAAVHETPAAVGPRQADPERCGLGVGSCASSKCCSPQGWCGNGKDYCAAPDCQQNFGPACDANQRPSGVDTSSSDRTHVGPVTYRGAGIYDCVNPGEIAITFDDGPYVYTSDLLQLLSNYNAKATFFITGNNIGKGMINDESTGYPDIIRRMHSEGHQVASHTWSHQNSSQTSSEQWTQQMVWNEIAINDVLGFFPTYMRPPYSICESQCQSILSDLGYHIVYFDLDTQGYLRNTESGIEGSKGILDQALSSSSPSSDAWLHIEHDLQYYVVNNLMPYMLEQLSSKGWSMVTVGQCLGDPQENWYRTVDGSGSGGGSDGDTTVSTDGTCGNNITCLGSGFGDCCSQYGWCGSTDGHCGASCQADFGSCTGGNGGGSGDLTVSTDGSCGGDITCQGSEFGNCCSQYGWCGSTTGYCAGGCQSSFGTCS